MLNYRSLQSAYVDLYIELRKYTWGFHTVEKLANLEVSVYRAFPNTSEVSECFKSLRSDVRHMCETDEDLLDALDNFEKLLDPSNTIYAKLIRVREVVQS